MLDLYLSDKYYETEWPKIQKLAESDTDEDFELLKKYALEGYRLATPAFGLLRKVETDATVQDGERTVNVKKGDQVFVDFVSTLLRYICEHSHILTYPFPPGLSMHRSHRLPRSA